MDTWINTLPKGLYLGLSWVAYPLITGWRGGDPKMAITRFGTRSIKGQSRFRGNPKSALQIKPALNTVAVVAWMCRISPQNAAFPIFKCLLIQGAVVDYSSYIFHPWFSVPSLLEMQIWSVTNDVGPSLTRSSPWRPHVAPQLTSSSSTVITLVGSLRLIILDFGMHCHCLHSLAPHTARFW